MTNPTVAVLAEGTREVPQGAWLPDPGDVLHPEEHLGAAHILVARSIADARGIPAGAVQFVEPLQVGRRRAKGSELLGRLKRLTTYPPDRHRPDVVVVFVDEDGQPERRTGLTPPSGPLTPPCVIGVAVREFEAWLVADGETVHEHLGEVPPPTPEAWAPREAKAWIDTRTHPGALGAKQRQQVAAQLDLAVLRSTCPSFKRFEDALAHALPAP